jgi:hypothetical protein
MDYFATVQPELRPHMRRIVTDWMLEVCEDQEAGPEVFLLAVHYLDSFLSTTTIRKSQFQLAAATCLLLASKLAARAGRPLPVDRLVEYTDHCYTRQELLSWELLLLHRLQWRLTTATSATALRRLAATSGPLAELEPEALELLVLLQAHHLLATRPPATLAVAALTWVAGHRGLGEGGRAHLQAARHGAGLATEELERMVGQIGLHVVVLEPEQTGAGSEEDLSWVPTSDSLYVDILQRKTGKEKGKAGGLITPSQSRSIRC